jgi:hypothetical protein
MRIRFWWESQNKRALLGPRYKWKDNIKMDLFFLIFIVGGGVQTGSTRHVGHLLAYCTCPG